MTLKMNIIHIFNTYAALELLRAPFSKSPPIIDAYVTLTNFSITQHCKSQTNSQALVLCPIIS